LPTSASSDVVRSGEREGCRDANWDDGLHKKSNVGGSPLKGH
jgi:hypothetical protein